MEPMKKVSFSTRSPLKELNSVSLSSSSSSSSSQSARGCLGFFLPNSSSKTPHRQTTPKSTPKQLKAKEKKIHICSCSSRAKAKERTNKCTKNMGSEGEALEKMDRESNTIDDTGGEPPVHSFARTPGKDACEERCATTTTATTTPPIQASISPEIQIGGVSTTPACFATGHLLSGVTDKRKCRPRGILAVATGEDLGLFCTSNGNADDSRLSLVPAPAEASMRWLLSPCEEDQEGSRTFLAQSPSSPSDTSPRRNAFLISPSQGHLSSPSTTPPCKAVNRYEEVGRESFSCNSSLSSQNVICTPQSHSSSERCVRFSWLKTGEGRLKFDPLVKETAMGDPVDVLPLPGFSFPFSDSSTALSNAGGHSGGLQSTSSEIAFGIRISWREGLASRIFEMDDDDEFDCCQWLSEEEDVQFKCNFGCELEQKVESGMNLDDDPMLPKSASEEPAAAIEQEKKVASPPATPINSCAESISTEGGGLLVASTDSDWTLCYKNHLFKL